MSSYDYDSNVVIRVDITPNGWKVYARTAFWPEVVRIAASAFEGRVTEVSVGFSDGVRVKVVSAQNDLTWYSECAAKARLELTEALRRFEAGHYQTSER